MEHSEYQELLALQAMEVLDAHQARSLRAHLESCADCSRELAELRDAAALLAHEAEPAMPSDEVRERILRGLQTESRPIVGQPSKVLSLPARRPSSFWQTTLRLAAAVAFVALLLGIAILWRRDVASRRQMDELARQVNRQQRELQIGRDNQARQGEALALLSSPDGSRIALAGTETAKTAHATFVYDQKSRHGMLMIEGLPATPSDKAYQMWFIPKGLAPIPGGTFTVSADGRALVSDNIPVQAGFAPVVAITLEPQSGSAAPTMPIYLASPAS